MLFCLIAMVAVSAQSALAWLSADITRTELGGPSTLELALIGIATLACYAVVRRHRRPTTLPNDGLLAPRLDDQSPADAVAEQSTRDAA